MIKPTPQTPPSTPPEPSLTTALEKLEYLRRLKLVGDGQCRAMLHVLESEERDWMDETISKVYNAFIFAPKPYETEDIAADKQKVVLHYFHGSWDWYIVERDNTEEQLQAFGLVRGCETEWGYTCIPEITDAGAELDLYWEPQTIAEVKAKLKAEKTKLEYPDIFVVSYIGTALNQCRKNINTDATKDELEEEGND